MGAKLPHPHLASFLCLVSVISIWVVLCLVILCVYIQIAVPRPDIDCALMSDEILMVAEYTNCKNAYKKFFMTSLTVNMLCVLFYSLFLPYR